MKKMITVLLVFLLLCMTGCGSSKPEEKPDEVPEEPVPAEDGPVEMEETVYEKNGVKITLLGYGNPDENAEYDSVQDIRFRIEKTEEDVALGILKSAADGWLLSIDEPVSIRTKEIPAEGDEWTLKISSRFQEDYGIRVPSCVDLLIAVKQGGICKLDHVHVPVASDMSPVNAVHSEVKGYYLPGILTEVANSTRFTVRVMYLVKAKDKDGKTLIARDNMSGEYVDGIFADALVKADTTMPAALQNTDYNFWVYEDDPNTYADPAEYTAEYLYASAYPDDDISETVTVTNVERNKGNDSHVNAYLEWPEDTPQITVYGTLIRYKNGQVTGVDVASSNGLDITLEQPQFLYFDAYDPDYEGETLETVINYAYERK